MCAKVGVIGASGYAGAELLRLARGPPRARRGRGHRRLAGRRADRRRSTRTWRPTTATRPSRPGTRWPSTGSTSCSWPCPTAQSQKLVPELDGRVGRVVDLAADFRLKDAGALPDVVRRGPHLPRAAGRLRLRAARAVPADDRSAPSLIAAPGCYVDRRGARAHAARAGRAGRDDRHRGRRGQRRVGRRAGRRSRTPPSAPSTRTSPPTACSTTATRPRSSRSIGAQVLFTPHLAPMNRGILATCYARPVDGSLTTGRRCSTCCGPPTPASRSSWSATARRRPRRPRARTPPTSPPRVDPRTGWVVACAALDNLGEGRGRPGRPVRQPRSSASPETTGLATAGLYP